MFLNSDKIRQRYAVKNENFQIYSTVFKRITQLFKYIETPIIGKLIKKIALLDNFETQLSQGYVLNINKDLQKDGSTRSSVLPIQLVRDLVESSEHRYILKGCICRTAQACKQYPHDFGCLFLGKGGQNCEKQNLAKEVSVEEALLHVDQAAELGLIAQTLFVEIEKYIWGIEEDRLQNWIELCFCCPCCCTAFNLLKHAGSQLRSRISSIGWKATVTDSCILCGKCVSLCPTNSISIWKNKTVSVAENCLGCGICASACTQKAIEIKQVLPVKASIKDYFRGYTPKV